MKNQSIKNNKTLKNSKGIFGVQKNSKNFSSTMVNNFEKYKYWKKCLQK